MKTNLILALLILLGSCSAEKQLQRALKRNPDLLKADTVVTLDTVITDRVRADTLLVDNIYHDTVIIKERNLTMKYVNNIHDSTVYLYGECAPDIIVTEGKTITNTIIKEPTWWINIKSYWWIVLVIIGVVLLIKGLKKIGL